MTSWWKCTENCKNAKLWFNHVICKPNQAKSLTTKITSNKLERHERYLNLFIFEFALKYSPYDMVHIWGCWCWRCQNNWYILKCSSSYISNVPFTVFEMLIRVNPKNLSPFISMMRITIHQVYSPGLFTKSIHQVYSPSLITKSILQ